MIHPDLQIDNDNERYPFRPKRSWVPNHVMTTRFKQNKKHTDCTKTAHEYIGQFLKNCWVWMECCGLLLLMVQKSGDHQVGS